jgi:hypothetical protein
MQDNNEISHPSTLENIDTAIYRFVDETLSPNTITNAGREKVNVLWMGSERTFQIKNNKELRDKVGKLRLPLITISRTSVSQEMTHSRVQSKQLILEKTNESLSARVIQQDKTQNFKTLLGSVRKWVTKQDLFQQERLSTSLLRYQNQLI